MRRAFLSVVVLLMGACATGPSEPVEYYVPPQTTAGAAVIHGEDSPGKFLGKGHEKIYVCKVDGRVVESADFDLPVLVSSAEHVISVCYREGLNTAEAYFEATFEADTDYQIRLGEHSWREVNLSIEKKESGEVYLGPATVPKVAGDATFLIFN